MLTYEKKLDGIVLSCSLYVFLILILYLFQIGCWRPPFSSCPDKWSAGL